MKTRKKNKVSKKRFTRRQYNSKEGMLTSIWGPSLWHFLHVISFNYPIHPTNNDKIRYYKFMKQLQYILPCKYCRENYKKNMVDCNFSKSVFHSRESFSRYVYLLHEHINKMLGKESNLSYNDVRDRYEHFRSRCNNNKINIEKGCIDPLHGIKPKCILHVMDSKRKYPSFKIDKL